MNPFVKEVLEKANAIKYTVQQIEYNERTLDYVKDAIANVDSPTRSIELYARLKRVGSSDDFPICPNELHKPMLELWEQWLKDELARQFRELETLTKQEFTTDYISV